MQYKVIMGPLLLYEKLRQVLAYLFVNMRVWVFLDKVYHYSY